jgi:hypothetical protein
MAAGAASAATCWCMTEDMPAPLTEHLQEEGVAWCICQACMRRAQQQQKQEGRI